MTDIAQPLPLFEAFFTIGEILLCVWLFCHLYPPRKHLGIRAGALGGGLTLAYGLAAGLGAPYLDNASSLGFFGSQLLSFAAVLAACVAVVMACWRISIWNALFCCTAGYTVQNLASGLHGFVMILAGYIGVPMQASTSGIIAQNSSITIASLLGTSCAVIGTVYLVYIRKLKHSALVEVEDPLMLIAAMAVLLFEIAFDLVNKGLSQPLPGGELSTFPALFLIVLKLTHLATCLLVLLMQYELLHSKRLQRDTVAIERMMQDQARQYEMSRESIEAINIRCHDIRHQIQDLSEAHQIDREALARIAGEVDMYDSAVKTGNDALDVILTEKSLLCGRDGITLSCIADGHCVDFMSAVDLYSFFGNALDNAMEAVRGIPDRGHRSISLIVRRNGDMVLIHVENYYSGNLTMREGIPITTKSDAASHGYGMKSMQLIAKRYGGTLACRAADGVFHLNVLMPLPEYINTVSVTR